jgi:hypothetical protein
MIKHLYIKVSLLYCPFHFGERCSHLSQINWGLCVCQQQWQCYWDCSHHFSPLGLWHPLKEYSYAPLSADSVSAVSVIRGLPQPEKKFESERNKQFVSFKTPAKQERAVTWWNPAAQMRPVFDSSSFAPILTFPCRTCLHSASSILAVRISCHIIAVIVFRKTLFTN